MKRTLTPIALGLLAATMLAATANAETLRWARQSDALTLDPHSQNQGVTHTFAQHIYEGLLGRDTQGNLTPRLATEWYPKDGDPSVWVFKLREGVKFHNGEDFTAEDVVFSINRARTDNSNMRQLHANVTDVVAIDDVTVEIQLSGPAPLYPNNVTNTFIMDKGWSEEHDLTNVQDFAAKEENYAVRNTNGTGPYILAERDPDVRSVLTYNEGWWGEKPDVTEIIYTPIADNATRVAALLSGEVDLVQDVPVQDIDRLANTAGVTVKTGPENRTLYFGFKLSEEPLKSSKITDANPFANPLVREAIALTMDRNAIQKVVMRGYSLPTCIPVPPFVNGWTAELDACAPTDLERARELMAEAGYPDGFSVTLDSPNDRYVNDEAISQALVGMLGQIGIDVTLASRPIAQHSPLILNSETDFYLLAVGVPTFDSAYVFNDMLHTKEGPYGSYNVGLHSNREVDERIEALATMTELDERNAVINEIWTMVKDTNVVLPVHNQVLAYAMKSNLNLDVHPENQPRMMDLVID